MPQKMTSNMENIQWRVPSLGALLLVLVFMPHLFSKVPYVNAAWVSSSSFFSVLLCEDWDGGENTWIWFPSWLIERALGIKGKTGERWTASSESRN